MNRREKFKEQLKKKSKFETVKTMIMSFTATVAAVVAIAVLVPSSPKATIVSARAFTHNIAFQVNVTDADGAITNETLKVVLENQLEYYEIFIEPGLSAGSFSDLSPGTEYNLSIRYDKGFGLENLASEKLKTIDRDGAAFLGVKILDPNYDYWIPYQIDVFYQNLLPTYQSLTLYIATTPDYDTQSDPIYIPYPVANEGLNTFTLEISNEYTKVHAYLEAVTLTNETIILEELNFRTPFILYASLSIDQITPTGFGVNFYPEYNESLNASYQIVVKQNNRVIKTIVPPPYVEGTQHSENLIMIDGLRPDTLYSLELHATYQDPITLRKETQILETIEDWTLPRFSYTLDVVDIGDFYEISITVDDPGHNYQLAYYVVYQPSVDYDIWLDYGESPFFMLNNVKQTSFTVPKTYALPYYIEIGLSSQNDYRYYIVIRTING